MVFSARTATTCSKFASLYFRSNLLRTKESIKIFTRKSFHQGSVNMANSNSIKTMFNNMASKQTEQANGNGDIEMANGDSESAKKGNKRLSVERIYQKKTQLEHILLRPDTYIGAVEAVTQPMWIYDEEEGMVNKNITFVPGLYKIFDEILVNAADNKQRDPKMDCIKIDIDSENNCISVWNNGKGIPVIMHKEENVFVPSMIFGILLTSSNYDDDQKKVTGGRNGFGAKLCNVFSTEFIVETACNEYGKKFKQVWTNNMTKTKEPKILPHKGDDYTKVTFKPDLSKFKMDSLDKDIVGLLSRRAYDIAGCCRGVKVMLNGKKLPVKTFEDYCTQYVKNKVDDLTGDRLKLRYENVGPRWEVAFAVSDKGFQQISFVNNIATTKGGRHVDHVTDQLVSKIAEKVKKENKDKISVKPFQIKNHMWVFVNCLIENPMFDSQTKENMTLLPKSFGSKCTMSDKFYKQVTDGGVVSAVMSWVKFKAQTLLEKNCHGSKHSKIRVKKCDEAELAGGAKSGECTLILTEGDSAKTLVIAGLGVIGRARYGVFPLKGKMLNVREASHQQILKNEEINNIIEIMGFHYKKKYQTPEELKSLRYGKIMIMTDQDQDGSHIKGLIINFIHHNWPNLLRVPFLEEFITPIVKVSKNRVSKSFYSLPEYEEWKAENPNWQTYKVKYYKGLGTSESKEVQEYFSEMDRHRIKFRYHNEDDDSSIKLAFSKKMIEQRKEWLGNSMGERKRRRELGLPEIYLYGKGCRSISYSDFINKELILFSNADNVRSIPSLVDGLKPGQRKVLYTCFKRKDKNEVKVAQLAGSVAEHSSYHHGEQSLASTIINLAQNFVGSNNINLLQPIGQFGSRLQGGKDSASPRYISTMLSPLAQLLFNENDTPLLKSQYDDNQKIEPEFYVPIIPMVLVNGAEGIGTGWSTKIPNYNPREIIKNLKRLLAGDELLPMIPWYKNFKGSIESIENQRYICNGEVAILTHNKIEITELPIKTWTQTYKESVMETMLHGVVADKTGKDKDGKATKVSKTPGVISDYKELHTDTTVKFVVTMNQEKLSKFEEEGMHKSFKLQTSMSTSSMVLFDSGGCLRKFENVEEILREFFTLRLEYYHKRKAYLDGMLGAEASKLDNQARFILEKISGKVVIENKKRKEIVRILEERGYDSDPVHAWKALAKDNEFDAAKNEESQEEDEEKTEGSDYDYLLGLSMWSLTEEKKDILLQKRDQKVEERDKMRNKTPADLWKEDLDLFSAELDIVEKKEIDDMNMYKQPKQNAGKGNARKKALHHDVLPSPLGQRVVPRIDPELRKKAERAAESKESKGRKKKEDKTQKKLDDIFKNMDEGEGQSLASRVGDTPDKIEKRKKSPVKKMKLTVDTSDESDDMFNSSLEEVQAKVDRPKRAKAAKTLKIDSSEDEWGSDGSESDAQPNNFPSKDESDKSDDEKFDEPPLSPVAKSDPPSDHDIVLSSDDSFKPEPVKKPKEKAAPKPKKTLGPKTKAEKKQTTLFDSLLSSGTSNDPPAQQDDEEEKDDFDFVVEETAKPAPPKKTKPSPKKRAKVDDSDSDAPKPKKPAAKKKKKAISDSEDDDMFAEKPKKTKAKKSKKAAVDSDDDMFAPKPAAKKGGKKKKPVSSDEDDFKANDSDDEEEYVPRARAGGRSRAPVKYQFDEDSDSN